MTRHLYSPYMSQMLDRFHKDYDKRIDCDPGWYYLIEKIDVELRVIDPEYTIYQIKEKFGALRFYFDTEEPPETRTYMQEIVSAYELISKRVCEITGTEGVLMKKGSQMKTLNPLYAPEGFIEC